MGEEGTVLESSGAGPETHAEYSNSLRDLRPVLSQLADCLDKIREESEDIYIPWEGQES